MKLKDILGKLKDVKRLAVKHRIAKIKLHNIIGEWMPSDEKGNMPFSLLVYGENISANDDIGPVDFKIALERLLECEVDIMHNPGQCHEEFSVDISFDDLEKTENDIVDLFNSDLEDDEVQLTADDIEFCERHENSSRIANRTLSFSP